MKICQQTRNITCDRTAGELSALLLESQKVKELQPLYNRRLRRVSNFYSIHLEEGNNGILISQIVPTSEIFPLRKKLYGLFPSHKKAQQAMQLICNDHNLCYQVCGLEKQNKRACSGHQLKKCAGYCVGKQPAVIHNLKMLQGLATLALKTWPYDGPIALVEKNQSTGNEHHILVDNWCVLGVAESLEDYSDILDGNIAPKIDKDTYRYLVTAIFSKKANLSIVQADRR